MVGEASGEASVQLEDYLAHVLTEVDGQPRTIVVSVPVPLAPLSSFLRAVPRTMTVLWDPAGDEELACATAGVTHRIDLTGPGRYAQLQTETNAIWQRIQIRTRGDCEPPPPRLFGGVAFADGSTGEYPWEEFSDGLFFLPRWTYTRDFGRARAILTLAADGEADRGPTRRQELLSEFECIVEALDAHEDEHTAPTNLQVPRIPQSCVRQVDFSSWREYVQRIQTAIKAGRFGKIVAARRSVVELPGEVAARLGPLDDIDVLTQLSGEPDCTRFAIRTAESTFLGATPELLFAKKGNVLTTHALAGTLRSLGSEVPVLSSRSSELLNSEKDLAEHEFVVSHIRASLAPYCSSIEVAAHPQVSKFRAILHLNTPIQARLKDGIHASQLLSALHPTPAVGGFPQREAAEWIAANEMHHRGWYAGAIGWIDSSDDARFVVAIRCGLLRRERAYIFTGAGIVENSDPVAEYAETDLKQLPLLRALGVVPDSHAPPAH